MLMAVVPRCVATGEGAEAETRKSLANWMAPASQTALVSEA